MISSKHIERRERADLGLGLLIASAGILAILTDVVAGKYEARFTFGALIVLLAIRIIVADLRARRA